MFKMKICQNVKIVESHGHSTNVDMCGLESIYASPKHTNLNTGIKLFVMLIFMKILLLKLTEYLMLH
jgi:hypothetical protein